MTRCMICQRPERRRLVDASYAEGMSAAAIARRETATGFKVGDVTVVKHLREHYMAPPPAGVAKTKKDLAAIVAERTVEWLEKADDDGEVPGPGHPFWRDGLTPGLQAQKIIDQREARTDPKQLMIAFAHLLSGLQHGVLYAPPERRQLEAGEVIEGEATEVE